MKTKSDNLYLIQEKQFENNLLIDTKVFDRKGNIVRHNDRAHFENRRKISREEEIFDDSGRLIATKWYINDLQQPHEMRYEYDERGNLVKETNFYQNRFDGEWVYFYDENNLKIRQEYFDSERKSDSFVCYEYNKHGQETAQIGYGCLKYKFLTKHSLKYMPEEFFYNDNGQLLWTTRINYKFIKGQEPYIYEQATYNRRGTLIHKKITESYSNNENRNVKIFVHKNYDKNEWVKLFLL